MNRARGQRLSILAAAAMISLAGFGCGEDASGTSETPASLTKPQFLERADKICQRGLEGKDAAVRAGLKKLSPSEIANPSKKRLEELGESIVAPIERLTTELRELPAPAKDEAAVQGIIAKLEAGLKKTEADPGSLAQSDPFANAADAARAYGLKACNL
jgi:hypothetical protein